MVAKFDNAFDSMALPVFTSVHYIDRDNRNAIAQIGCIGVNPSFRGNLDGYFSTT